MVKKIYKVIRSIVFSLTLVAVGLYVFLYILISIPPFQNYVKNLAVNELSLQIGSEIKVESLRIVPFNEVVVNNLVAYDLQGRECLKVETLGAGISLWKLLSEQRIELTYGEIIGLKALIVQEKEEEPFNIQFIIDAFASKDKEKEKKHFELALRNVVLRKSSVSLRREWLENRKSGFIDQSNIEITNLRADISFPMISDRGVDVDLRRLSLEIPGITEINKMSLKGSFGPEGIFLKGFTFDMAESRIFIPSFSLPLKEGTPVTEVLKSGQHEFQVTDSYLTPSDFEFLLPQLSSFNRPLPLNIDIKGNLNHLEIDNFHFGDPSLIDLLVIGTADNLTDKETLSVDIQDFKVGLNRDIFTKILPGLPDVPQKVKEILTDPGDINLEGTIAGQLYPLTAKGTIEISGDVIDLFVEGDFEKKENAFKAAGEIVIENLLLEKLLPETHLSEIKGDIVVDAQIGQGLPEGRINASIEKFNFKGREFDGLSLNLSNEGGSMEGDFLMDNAIGNVVASFNSLPEEELKKGELTCNISNLNLSEILDMKKFNGYLISGNINLDAEGRDLNDLEGKLQLEDFSFTAPDLSRKLILNSFIAEAGVVDSLRSIRIDSDWIRGTANGKFKFRDVVSNLTAMVHQALPALVKYPSLEPDRELSDMDIQLEVQPVNNPLEFFNLPFRLLVPIDITATIDGLQNTASFALDLPYLQQGKNKLIYDSRIVGSMNGGSGDLNLMLETTMPVKRGDLALSVLLTGENDRVTSDIRWQNTESPDFRGSVSLATDIRRNDLSFQPEFFVNLNPSVLSMGTAEWLLDRCKLAYSDKKLIVEGLKVWHDDQYVEIDGIASPDYSDVLSIGLADIDVDYIFDTLKINYVTFGGTATGEVEGHGLLGSDMSAETDNLKIENFSYNGAVIGNCDVSSRWNNAEKEVEINAEIFHEGNLKVKAAGGVWVTRDSLAFDIAARKVPVEFIQPFMSVFSSHVGGFATGDISLFGTFKDIDLVGKIFADSVAMKLDYTNTVYHGSDSVILNPGRIVIPSFTLYDRNGNSAVFSGELTHRYFHEPSFTFRLTDAQNFLCYDTNSDLNPDWYGTLYGTGSAIVRGFPGVVDITADMTVSGNSNFTFVLNETEFAQDYQFLTFSDRQKELKQSLERKPEDFKTAFMKKVQEESGAPSRFGIDIRASVTPSVLFTLVMDPAAGDKITARGRGAMQVKYESDDDEMQMYGKYEIEEGNYNFSLQDIILRDFKIKEGSFITFNGDPLDANLDISAAYRVNTNLSDLDKSFSSDRDLARTNVPVDAILMVKGDMQSPEITFDVELPTLTQDVERKVKSIISTDDMMNRQIIYLLALNRFYTPEYMGSTGNGGELAAVASTTLSSQLSNILGQLTDKFTVSPSFRSDKGDFSDIEVDVALSSRLLNNRLLINGNFGYRDRSTSNTTFVGDFDVEYLLSRNGNLRLKAYNHFNDQNYYLREALTTQGLGVVWRKDFDSLFPNLKKKKEDDRNSENMNTGEDMETSE